MNYALLVDNLKKVCVQKNISINKCLTESRAGKNFISNITAGSEPALSKITLLADYLNISTDYLLGITENLTTTNDSEVNQSPIRIEVEKLINQLSPEMLEVEFSHLRSLLEIQDKNNK